MCIYRVVQRCAVLVKQFLAVFVCVCVVHLGITVIGDLGKRCIEAKNKDIRIGEAVPGSVFPAVLLCVWLTCFSYPEYVYYESITYVILFVLFSLYRVPASGGQMDEWGEAEV